MTHTDTQLKQALAKMLPETLLWDNGSSPHNTDREPDDAWGLCWDSGNPVLDTELLHLCWMVEETLNADQIHNCKLHLLVNGYWMSIHATWQQRTIALAKVKGVEI